MIRTSIPEPIGLQSARREVLGAVRPLPAEAVGLREALGRRLAEDAVCEEPVPAADNSAMDGFAVRSGDTAGAAPADLVGLRVRGESRAGHPPTAPLGPGEAYRISTGAAIPDGADAIVPQEEVRVDGEEVLLGTEAEAGRFVRRAGDDLRRGETALRAGTSLGPAELGVLASLGRGEVSCHRRPTVAVLTCGDELLDPAAPPRPGGVRDSNGASVPALAAAAGAEVVSTERAPDDPGSTREAVARALRADVAVICGGVSVGPHDHVRDALEELGAERAFWGVALKPGRPTWFGTHGSTAVFGLPGNPVSAMVVFLLLARPALAVLSGGPAARQSRTAVLDRDYPKEPGRAHAIRCRLTAREDGWHAEPAPRQGSHVLTSMLGADCLAIAPADRGALRAGERVEIELLGSGPA